MPQTEVNVAEEKGAQGYDAAGAPASGELVQALTAIELLPRDIAIMQSIAAAGALEAELEVM
ncbi:MAG: flagellar basal body P-ring protein FlgI [Bryobacterales bacterium]